MEFLSNINWDRVLFYTGKIGVVVTALFVAYVVFKAMIKALKKGEEVSKDMIHSFDVNIQKKGQMNEKQLYMSKVGIMYRFGTYDMKPSQYMLLRFAIGILIALIGILLGGGAYSLVAIPIGYFATDFLFKGLNKQDNEAMMMDIYNTYANLKIQLVSGIYIGDCMEYTYKIVQNERYKEALKELLLNFSDKTITSSEAIEIFRNRFNSRNIDKLCAMLSSFVEYGISDSYLQDIMFEVQELLEADEIKSRHDIETKTGMITFAFFVLVVILVAFGMAGSMGGVGSFILGT